MNTTAFAGPIGEARHTLLNCLTVQNSIDRTARNPELLCDFGRADQLLAHR
jgi:hypothetical protein